MATLPTSRPANVKSRLLPNQENETILSILGERCLTLGTTLAELSKAEDAKRETWKKMSSGVVCFVKDCDKRSYFIRLYDPESKAVVWEHDVRLRNPRLQLNTTNDGLLTIIVNDHKLSFTDKGEAVLFKTVVEENMRNLQRRRVRTGPPGPKKEKKKLTKVDKIDPEMKALFEQIGLRDQSNVDKESFDLICDFVGKHGGLEAVKHWSALKQHSSVPPPPPPGRSSHPPPPPVNRSVFSSPPPPVRSSYSPPPPGNRSAYSLRPPPGRSSRPTPPPVNRSAIPPPPPAGRVSRPPPPPVKSSALPPPPSRKQETLAPPVTKDKTSSRPSSGDATSLKPSSPNTNNGEESTDNPLKQQIMQLLLQNPSEITDFIDQKGGLQDIKEALAGRNSQLDPSEDDGGQVHGKASTGNISSGATSSTFDHDVGSDMLHDDVGSDMLDDDDDEWDD